VIWRRLGRERSHIRFREGRDAARARLPENQVTEWDSFRALDFKRLAELLTSPSIVDLRNVYRPEDVRRRFRYVGVGISNGNDPNGGSALSSSAHDGDLSAIFGGFRESRPGHQCSKSLFCV
jgi:hypothetical protein